MSGSMNIKKFFEVQPHPSRGTPQSRLTVEREVRPRYVRSGSKGGCDCGVPRHGAAESPSLRIGAATSPVDSNTLEEGLAWSQDDTCNSAATTGEMPSFPSELDSPTNGRPLKKHKISPLRSVEADEPAVGSLFNTNVKPSDKSGDIMSARFDPSLFDITPYVPTFPPPGHQDSLLFGFLAEILEQADNAFRSGLGSRKYVYTLLSNFFRVLIYHKPTDVIKAVYIMMNKISPEYEGEEIGVGDVMLVKAMAESYGKSEKIVKQMVSEHEDLGIVAGLSSCTSQTIVKMPDLTIASVLNQFRDIAAETGKNSVTRKKDIIKRMLICAKQKEAKYIIRCLQQKLRVGVSATTLFQSIADATYLTKAARDGKAAIGDIRTSGIRQVDTIDEMEKAVKTATTHLPCMETVVGHLLDGDNCQELLEHCKIRPGIPVRPMLAKAVSKTAEILQAIGGEGVTFTCEYKYDGERVQLHLLRDRTIKLFSRNMENLCGKYPDVMESFRICVKPDVVDCILDCEVVAYDPENGKIMPFQQLSTRKRKGVTVKDISIPVCMYPFDVLYLNGESLVTKPLAERRRALEAAVHEKKNLLNFACRKDMNSLDEIDDFLRQAVSDSCEGLMIKSLHQDATYEPQKRTNNWLKFKKDYIEGMGDSVDLVPIAAFLGKGKRTSVYGSYLLAVYDPVQEVYQSVCKTGSGFNDQTLKDLYEDLQEHVVSHKLPTYEVSEKLEPDVWLNPVKVWECKAADLSISPIYTAAQDLTPSQKVSGDYVRADCQQGIGLRFPRFIRMREDKDPTDATTSQQIYEMYESQFNKTLFEERSAPSKFHL
ncbi:DNA ligase 1 [Babesia caballi]|uniref:DNA ligase n=1 Tax=Babesia caballi TaxID=5871 RepID=A0AAV4LY44_BABCB|nr:DNA ligase 1 [Babesia caballi]